MNRMKVHNHYLQQGYIHREPTPWLHVFGYGPWYTWCLPTDPDFQEDPSILGYRLGARTEEASPLQRVRTRSKGWR